MTIIELNNKVQAFDLELTLDKVVLENEKFILDKNKEQLYSGVDANNESLGNYKSEFYANYKLQKNPAGVVDLKDTGDFYNAFKLDNTDYEISSTDEKTKSLTAKYGKNIFGLTKENTGSLIKEKINPQLLTAFKNAIK